MLRTIRLRKLKRHGHVTKDKEGARSGRRPRRMYMDDVTEWTEINEITAVKKAYDRGRWRKETVIREHQWSRLLP